MVGSGPVPVAGPFTHNSILCDNALGYAPGRQLLQSSAPDLPPVAVNEINVALQDLTPCLHAVPF